MNDRPSTRWRFGAVAALAAVGLLAGACSSAGDSSDDSSDTSVRGVSETDVTIASDGPPTPGGSLSYGLEAESDGFDPTKNRWAISGIMVGMAVYDPLTALDVNAEPKPYLAESITPNDDYDEWTIVLRPDVTFHDGSPLTSEAVKATLDGHKASALTSSAVAPIESVEIVDDLTARVVMNQPWVAFPAAMTAQVGMVVSPTTLADPDGSRDPIGTGPFDQQDWIPNNQWVGAKYDGYWRTDEDGNALPYLDELVFRPFPDIQSRSNALESGQLDMIHLSNPDNILRFRELAADGEVQIVEDRGEGEETFVLLNMADPVLKDPEVRRALALATDRETFAAVTAAGVPEVANSAFTPSSPWRVETDYPDFNLEEATALVEQIEAESGPISISLATTPSPDNNEAAQLLQQMWGDAGIDVTITTVDQTQFINTAITGDYQANLWRQFGAPDPDVDMVWWISETGGVENILNFPNWFQEDVDAALQEGRQNPDLDARRQAYADLQEYMARDLPYLWLYHTTWAVVADNAVRDITNGTLPDGEEAIPLGGTGTFGGTHKLVQTWLDR